MNGSCNYQNYIQEDLAKAVAAFAIKKMSTRKVEEVFGIPISTTNNKVKEKFTNAASGQCS